VRNLTDVCCFIATLERKAAESETGRAWEMAMGHEVACKVSYRKPARDMIVTWTLNGSRYSRVKLRNFLHQECAYRGLDDKFVNALLRSMP